MLVLLVLVLLVLLVLLLVLLGAPSKRSGSFNRLIGRQSGLSFN